MFAEWERPKLRRILSDPSAGVVVREHRDWLAGFGVERDMIEVLTSMCARLYGHRGARNWPCAVTAAGHEGVATRWQDVEPPVRPSLREQATQEAVKRQPRTGNRRARRGPPRRKARLP